MTASKIEKLRKELIDKHGDRVLINLVNVNTNKTVASIKLSNVIIRNSADMKEIERILKERYPRKRKVDIDELKRKYCQDEA